MKSKKIKSIELVLLIMLALFSIFISITNVVSEKLQEWYWIIIFLGANISSMYHELKRIRKQHRVWIHIIQLICSCLLILMLLFYLLTSYYSIIAFGLIIIFKQVLTLITQEKEESPEY